MFANPTIWTARFPGPPAPILDRKGPRLDRRCQMTTFVYFANDERLHLGAGSMSYEQLPS